VLPPIWFNPLNASSIVAVFPLTLHVAVDDSWSLFVSEQVF
jgi:hypothetical protein